MTRKINLTLLVITLVPLIFSSVVLLINYKDLGDFNVQFYKSKAVVSSAEPNKSKSLQFIKLRYLDLNGKIYDNRYSRTPTNGLKYNICDSVNIWINKLDSQDIIIDNALEFQNKIMWLIFVLSFICLIGNIFWTRLKGILY